MRLRTLGAAEGTPVLGAAQRNLDGEDRSERIRLDEKGGAALASLSTNDFALIWIASGLPIRSEKARSDTVNATRAG